MKFNEKKYLEHHGLICPYCGSEEISADHMEFDDNYGWRDVSCETCQEIWREVYTLTAAEEINI